MKPFETVSTSVIKTKAELPHDFRPSIGAVVGGEAELRKFLILTESQQKGHPTG